MPLTHRLLLATLLLTLAACAAPRGPEPTAAPTVVPPPQTATVTAAPPMLAGHLPLAVWDGAGLAVSLVPVHPHTGAPLAGEGWNDLGQSYLTAFAPDGRTLALLIYSDAHAGGGVIHFIDLPTWTMAEVTVAIASYPMFVQFTADSRSLLVAGTDAELTELARYTVADGAEAARVKLPFTPHSAGLGADAEHLLLYGTHSPTNNGLNPVAHAARLDLETLTVQWSQPLPEVRDGQYAPAEAYEDDELWAVSLWHSPAVIWAAGTATLYLVHADADQLTTVDFAAQTVRTAAIAPAQSWLERLLALTADVAEAKMLNGTSKQGVLGPDGRLYVIGTTTTTIDEFTETPLGLQVIDPATGALLATVDTAARALSLGADAAGAPVLLLEGWGERHWSEVRALADPHTVLAELEGVGLVAGRLPDGQSVLVAREDRAYRTVLQVIDPATWAAVAEWPATGFAQPLLRP